MEDLPDKKPRVTFRLARVLGLSDAVFIGIGALLGGGIFTLTGLALGFAGPSLLLVIFLNGIIALMTALAYAELGSALPEAGGAYIWVKKEKYHEIADLLPSVLEKYPLRIFESEVGIWHAPNKEEIRSRVSNLWNTMGVAYSLLKEKKQAPLDKEHLTGLAEQSFKKALVFQPKNPNAKKNLETLLGN